jgi:hypothetical protein
MANQAYYLDYQDYFEYHGNTAIEVTRKLGARTIKREWILFDSIKDAQEFFNDNCFDFGS